VWVEIGKDHVEMFIEFAQGSCFQCLQRELGGETGGEIGVDSAVKLGVVEEVQPGFGIPYIPLVWHAV
jgi:hypothetical protein